jgi:hypothetical protein
VRRQGPRADDADGVSPLGNRQKQEPFGRGPPKQQKPLLRLSMVGIRKRDGQRIPEHRRRLLKADPVLLPIRFGFDGIPLDGEAHAGNLAV